MSISRQKPVASYDSANIVDTSNSNCITTTSPSDARGRCEASSPRHVPKPMMGPRKDGRMRVARLRLKSIHPAPPSIHPRTTHHADRYPHVCLHTPWLNNEALLLLLYSVIMTQPLLLLFYHLVPSLSAPLSQPCLAAYPNISVTACLSCVQFQRFNGKGSRGAIHGWKGQYATTRCVRLDHIRY